VQPAELEIDDLAHDARGIGRVQGKVAFVSGALPGELVRVKHLHHGQNFDHGQLDEVLRASPDRVTPRCAHFGGCAGCSLQHFAPEAQIAWKQGQLLADLKKFGRAEPERILPPLVDAPFGYRRKARLSVKDVQKKGKVLVGFREPDGRYVADLSHCHTLHPAIGDKLALLARLVESLQIRRDLAQIEVAISELAQVLVFRHLKPIDESDQRALIAFGIAHGFDIWLQPKGNDSIHVISPNPRTLQYQLPEFDLTIEYQPLDFTQVNFSLNRKMLSQAMQLLAPAPGDHILDLFCGLGNFTLPMARLGARVAGVEGDAGFLLRAKANAVRNGLGDKVEYAVADLTQLHQDTPWARANYNKMLLDPPRAGAQSVLQYLPGKSVQHIVYVSCSPATLARDTEVLVHTHGFKLKAAGVMDMFTHTSHVESMALFERS
jgi:23S rRNA (uracil1939-C5)-methyltransferase